LEHAGKSIIFYLNQDILPAPTLPRVRNEDPAAAMKQARYTTDPSPPAPPSTPGSDQDTAAAHSGFLNWLAYFTLYLGTVAIVCAIGFYFFWQIPLPQDISQLLKSAGDSPTSRSLTAATAPPTASAKLPTSPLQPLANPSATSSSGAAEMAAATPSSTVTPETDSDPNAPPQVIDSPIADAPVEPAAPVEVTPVEEPPTPKPQTEIEQRLAEGQQQMDSRRLTAPANNNALRSYQRVLELDPNNAAARAGIDRIAAYYRDVAEQSLRQGRPDESLAYVSRGLRATPQHPDLLNLRRQARLIQQQREQAQLEEMRRQQAEQELAEQQYQERLRQQQRLQESSPSWWQQPPNYENNAGFNQR
jgi:hypothetical protein